MPFDIKISQGRGFKEIRKACPHTYLNSGSKRKETLPILPLPVKDLAVEREGLS